MRRWVRHESNLRTEVKARGHKGQRWEAWTLEKTGDRGLGRLFSISLKVMRVVQLSSELVESPQHLFADRKQI